MEHARLVHWVVQKYSGLAARDNSLSVEDLTQAGFEGLCAAAQSYDPAAGAFTTWAVRLIRQYVLKALRPSEGQQMPVSLNMPLDGSDAGSDELIDSIADPAATDPAAAVEAESFTGVLERALFDVSTDYARILKLTLIDGLSVAKAARALHWDLQRARRAQESGLAALRNNPSLLEWFADYATAGAAYRHKGVAQFRSDNTSTVEAAAIRRARLIEKVNLQ